MNAQESFEWYIARLEEKLRKLREHTERVAKLCEEFADEHPGEVDRKLLLDAAWLHDIAKYHADKDHHDYDTVLDLFAEYEEHGLADGIDKEKVAEIISRHKGKFDPKKRELECAALRLCDKLDKFERGQSDAKKSCEKTLKKIEKSEALGKSELEELMAFYKRKLPEG